MENKMMEMAKMFWQLDDAGRERIVNLLPEADRAAFDQCMRVCRLQLDETYRNMMKELAREILAA